MGPIELKSKCQQGRVVLSEGSGGGSVSLLFQFLKALHVSWLRTSTL